METKNNILITGITSGLGKGFAQLYLKKGWRVYGVSRRTPKDLTEHPNLVFTPLDVSQYQAVPETMKSLLSGVEQLNLVILNAGVLGRIKDMSDTSLDEITQVMDINVWSNKVMLDFLKLSSIKVQQIITISSGAAVNGNRGWGAYSVSKAALNMVTKLYATEMPDSHLTALAPGLVDTAMQDYLCEAVDDQRFGAIAKLKAARNTPQMPDPDAAAHTIADLFPRLLEYESGSFVDVRKI